MSTARRGITVKAAWLLPCVCLFACAADAGTPQLDFAAQVGGIVSENAAKVWADSETRIITGFFSGTADIDPSSDVHNVAAIGNLDIYVTKIDAEGAFIWGVSIGGLGEEQPFGISADSTGSVIVVGYFSETVDFNPGIGVANRTSTGDDDLFILKLSTDGGFVWVKTLGGSDDDTAHRIAVDQNDNVYVCGRFAGSVNFNPNGNGGSATSNGDSDFFVLKLRSGGEFIWVATVGGDNFDDAQSIAIGSDGNPVVVGSFSGEVDFDPGSNEHISEPSDSGIFVLKLTSKGKFLLAAYVEVDNGTAFDVTSDSASNIFVTGTFEGTTDFDPGNGVHELTTNQQFGDMFFLKLNAVGEFQFAGATAGNTLASGESISVDQFGNCFIGGYFRGIADFDASGATASLTSAGLGDAFLLQLNKFGNYVWAGQMGSTGGEAASSVFADLNGNVLVSGIFVGTVDFDPNAGTEQLTSAGPDGFFCSLNYLQRGAVSVKLKPKAARKDGARWRLDDDPTFRKSGAVVEDVLEGAHTLHFKDISGWTTPNDKEIVVDPNVTNSATAKYKQ